MNAAVPNRVPGRGPELLIARSEAAEKRPSAALRLEQLLEPNLARLLLFALAAGVHKSGRP